MKKVTYLTAPVVILALFVLGLGCSNDSPTVLSSNEIIPQTDAPIVSSEDEAVPQLIPVVPGNPTGNCCPEGFDIESGIGETADRNGDGAVCRRITPGGTITIDNIAPSQCTPCLPPNCEF